MRFPLSLLRSLLRFLRWLRWSAYQPTVEQDECDDVGTETVPSLWRDPEFITSMTKAGDTLIKLLWFLLALVYAAGCFDPLPVFDSPVVRVLMQMGRP